MAFTRPIPKPVCPCGAPAEVQVVDHYEPVGCFCQTCGNREVERRATEVPLAIRGSEPPSSLSTKQDAWLSRAGDKGALHQSEQNDLAKIRGTQA